jgi:hypothetical protein
VCHDHTKQCRRSLLVSLASTRTRKTLSVGFHLLLVTTVWISELATTWSAELPVTRSFLFLLPSPLSPTSLPINVEGWGCPAGSNKRSTTTNGENHFLCILVCGVLESRWVDESFWTKNDTFSEIRPSTNFIVNSNFCFFLLFQHIYILQLSQIIISIKFTNYFILLGWWVWSYVTCMYFVCLFLPLDSICAGLYKKWCTGIFFMV